MGKRLLSLLTALALAVSALASLAVAPAGAVVEALNPVLYVPYLPNGEELSGTGPWYGTVTVQNLTDQVRTVRLRNAAQTTTLGTLILNPYASATISSGQLFGTNAGGGVVIDTQTRFTLTATRGANANGADTLSHPCRDRNVQVVEVSQGATVFARPGDYTVTAITATTITISWGPAGNEPVPGTTYTVVVECPEPPIAAVVKTVAPVASGNARTSGQHEIVSGYTALGEEDVTGNTQYVYPIVQTNNGWNSVHHFTNFGDELCPVTVTFYQSPTGFSDPSFGAFTKTLEAGETWHVDLLALGFPEGWVGQAWVSVSDCRVGSTVDRIKAEQPWGDPVNMALTNQALPVSRGNTVQALPLIFQGYNGWNTGISIANLSTTDPANVTITYYNNAGVAVGTDSRVIQPRAMEFVYRPATTDVGIGGFGQALVRSNRPVLVAVDSVKYTGAGQDVGQALGYLAQSGALPGEMLALPLFQKGGVFGNDDSGVALFNTGGAPANVQLELRDASGARVAPTLVAPVAATIPAHGGFIFYAPEQFEMPSGFQGSVLVANVGGPEVVGVSNNVNYDVQYDGSAAYNMPVATPQMRLACEVLDDPQVPRPVAGNANPDCTVTLTGPDFFAGLPVSFEIFDTNAFFGITNDDFSFDVPANPDQNIRSPVPFGLGTLSADLFWRADPGIPPDGSFTIAVIAYVELDGIPGLTAGDVFLAGTLCTF